MLYADTKLGRLRVWFQHEHPGFTFIRVGLEAGPVSAVTYCRISNVMGVQLWTGRAYCSSQDQFCKETGRKIALSRALQKATVLDKQDRTTIWRLYHERTGRHNAATNEANSTD